MAQRLFLLPDVRELGPGPRPNWREPAQLTPAREVHANTHLHSQQRTQNARVCIYTHIHTHKQQTGRSEGAVK